MRTTGFRGLDAVDLRRGHGAWAPGTTGTVLQV